MKKPLVTLISIKALDKRRQNKYFIFLFTNGPVRDPGSNLAMEWISVVFDLDSGMKDCVSITQQCANTSQ